MKSNGPRKKRSRANQKIEEGEDNDGTFRHKNTHDLAEEASSFDGGLCQSKHTFECIANSLGLPGAEHNNVRRALGQRSVDSDGMRLAPAAGVPYSNKHLQTTVRPAMTTAMFPTLVFMGSLKGNPVSHRLIPPKTKREPQ